MGAQPLLSDFIPISLLSAQRGRLLSGALSACVHLLLAFFAFHVVLQVTEPGVPEQAFNVTLTASPSVAEDEPEILPQLVRVAIAQADAPLFDITPDAAELEAIPLITESNATAGQSNYLAQLWRRIHGALQYPRDAQLSGIQGVVVVHAIFGKDGTVHLAEIDQSSGNAELDVAALQAVSRYRPFLPIPDSLGLAYFNTLIPIRFGIRVPRSG